MIFKIKLENFGYEVELQEFFYDMSFGDIVFAKENPNDGWIGINNKIYGTQHGAETWPEQFSIFILAANRRSFFVVNQNVALIIFFDLDEQNYGDSNFCRVSDKSEIRPLRKIVCWKNIDCIGLKQIQLADLFIPFP